MTSTPGQSASRRMYDAFAQYGSGVLLVSVRDGDEDRFFVAASVLTASVDPFALAVSVGRRRPALAAMLDGGRWCVSVLQSDHRGLVEQLPGETTAAQRVAALTAAGAECSPEGVLWLPSALTTLWCTTASAVTVNDQMLLVGDVSRAETGPAGAPLLRWNHEYRTVAESVARRAPGRTVRAS